MGNLTEMQKLLRRQKSYMKGLLVMTEKLFDIQNQIAVLNFKEIKNNNSNCNTTVKLFTSKEVCDLLNLSQSTLYRMRMVNGFPFVKVEGRKNIMYNRQDIFEYINKNK